MGKKERDRKRKAGRGKRQEAGEKWEKGGGVSQERKKNY